MTPPSFLFWSLFPAVLLVFLATVERPRCLPFDEVLLLPRQARDRDRGLALRLRLRDMVRLAALLRRLAVSWLGASLVLERCSPVTATASADADADGSVADATARLIGSNDVWSDPPSVIDCCCCVCCFRSEEVGDVTVFSEVVCFFSLASEALVGGLSASLTVVDVARAVFVSCLRGDLERARLQRSAEDDARLAALTERSLTGVDTAFLDLAGDFRAVTRAHFFWTGEARALDEGRFVDADLGRPAREQVRAAAARFGVTLRALLFDERELEDAADVLRHGAMMSDARLNDRCSQTQYMPVLFCD